MTAEITKLWSAITKRAIGAGLIAKVDSLALQMDLASVPDLDLQDLLDAPAIDFAHDISGIRHHMDRSHYPGRLKNCFVPRCCHTAVVIPKP